MPSNIADESAPLLGDASVRKSRAFERGAKAVLAALAVAGVVASAVYYGPHLFATPDLAKLITKSKLESHLVALGQIAAARTEFGGSRSVMNGYNASVDYIVDKLTTKTDYKVTIQPFQFPFFENYAPPELSFSGTTLVAGKDFDTIGNSGNGTVTNGRLQAVTSGCTIEDYSSFKKGSVVLLAREADSEPGCTYRTKITNAIKAGASGVLLYTILPAPGPVLGRCGPDCVNTPVLGIAPNVALELLQLLVSKDKVTVSLKTSVRFRSITTLNVIADTPAGDANNVIVAGSHLDSVPAGPGINDDGSGSAATLEVALSLYKTGLSKKVINKVRFCWWSAEEIGLLGSTAYVDDLVKNNPSELERIVLNLNNDMIASPNGVRFIYNGREAEDATLRGPSGKIQQVFEDFFDSKGQYHSLTPFDGRSDYGPFLKQGIPAGGLFTGAEKIKTEEEAQKYGGTAGVPYDPCYHQACDTLENIQGLGMSLLTDLASAMGYIVQKFAFQENLREFLWNGTATA
ncbi:hypothetical protein HDV05_006657 [Chytridiales sp. JEL 0842]|nr:hypothetical protein HDV05_006657 [Chytridiales sp. JEL 0842]